MDELAKRLLDSCPLRSSVGESPDLLDEFLIHRNRESSHGVSYTHQQYTPISEDKQGSWQVYLSGEEAHLGTNEGELPRCMRLPRPGRTDVQDVRGIGFAGKIFRHSWPTCPGDCDLTTPRGVLMAMVTGPADTLALFHDGRYPFFATGLSYWPSPHYLFVAIPVHEENMVEFAALSEAYDLVLARWDKPTG